MKADIIDKIPLSASLGSMEAKAEDVINLGIGDTQFDTPSQISADTGYYLSIGNTHYTDSKGLLVLRESVAKYLKKFDIDCDHNNIIITPGATQALFYTLFLHIEPGMKVGLFEPAWIAYKKMILALEGEPVFIPLKHNIFDLEVLHNLSLQNIDILIINNPTNPSGKVWSKDELDIITEYCKKHNIKIIADEVYNEIVYEEEFVSLGKYEDIPVISSFSKTFAMTGWRLGYIYSKDKKFLERINKIQQMTVTCPTSFVQHGIVKFERELEKAKKLINIYKVNRNILYETLIETGLKPIYPNGTFYMWVDVGRDGKEFAKILLERYKIIVVPGESYGEHTKNFVRFSYAVPTELLIEACERMKE